MEFSMRNMMSDKSGLIAQVTEMNKKLDKIERSLEKDGYKMGGSSSSSSSSSSSEEDDAKKFRKEVTLKAAGTTIAAGRGFSMKRKPTIRIQEPEKPKR